MKIALIGANGQLGTDLAKVIPGKKDFELVALTRKDVDIRHLKRTTRMLSSIDPDVVINTAAYHKVDEVEENPKEAFLVNSVAVKNMAEFCALKDKTFIFISTDYVFGGDGHRKKLYEETDLPAPINVYGVSKLAGEHMAALCPKHYIVRTSGLFGMAGPSGKGENFVELMIRLVSSRDEIRVVKDQILSPTYTIDLAEQIIHLLGKAPYGTYHMVSEGQCSRFDFVREILEIMEIDTRCVPVLSHEFSTRAERPGYSALSNAKLKKLGINKMRPRQESLRDYLVEKGHI